MKSNYKKKNINDLANKFNQTYNKKGFTLVELLAVIAILAILVLIAMPNVLSQLKNARKKAFETEVKTICREAEKKHVMEIITNSDTSEIYCKSNESDCNNIKQLDLSGGNKTEYVVSVNSNGKITYLAVTNGQFNYESEGNSAVDCSSLQSAEEVTNETPKLEISTSLVKQNNYIYAFYTGKRNNFIHQGSNINELIEYFETPEELVKTLNQDIYLRLRTEEETVKDIAVCIMINNENKCIETNDSQENITNKIDDIFGQSSCEKILDHKDTQDLKESGDLEEDYEYDINIDLNYYNCRINIDDYTVNFQVEDNSVEIVGYTKGSTHLLGFFEYRNNEENRPFSQCSFTKEIVDGNEKEKTYCMLDSYDKKFANIEICDHYYCE